MRAARGLARTGAAAVAAAALLAVAGCDDQVKYVPWFETMSHQPSVETYEEPPRTPPEGSVPVDGRRSWSLLEADASLANPLEATDEAVLARGRELYGQFCTPCHGVSGSGDGPVVMPQRERGIPYTPALDLHSENARGLSDGYVWGMITDGRGLMPSYRRVPPEDRWRIVSWVRQLQAEGGGR